MIHQNHSDHKTPQRKILARTVTYKNFIGLGLGTIVGIGWVIMAGDLLRAGGSLGAILGFIVGGLLLIIIGLCYAELTPAIPVAGGEIAFAYKAFGTGPAFLTAWLLSFGYIAIGPFETVAMGWLFEYIFPGLKTQALYSFGGHSLSMSSLLPGLIIAAYIIYINYRGVKITARFQMFAIIAMLFCATIFIAIAFIKGSFSNLLPLFSAKGTLFIAGPVSIIAVLGMTPYFYGGFDIIPQASEESGEKVAPRDLGKAIIVSLIAGAVFYAAVMLALSLCMPWRQAIKLEMPTADVFQVAFGYAWAAKIVLFAAFLGLVTSLNGKFLASCRVLFAMGRGGLLPKWYGDTSKKYQTPKNAVLFVGVIALIGPFIGKAVLLPIVRVGSLGYITAWFITCLATIHLRKTAPEMNRPFKVKRKFVLYFGALFSGGLVLLMIIPGSSAQLKWPLEYIIFGTWLVLGYIGYRWRLRTEDMKKEERDYQILGEYR
ncbi:APC family permease [Acidobacteriota bacterium]